MAEKPHPTGGTRVAFTDVTPVRFSLVLSGPVFWLENREDILDKLVYIITNPVKDGLVARGDDWPGASGYRALLRRLTLLLRSLELPARIHPAKGSVPNIVGTMFD